MNDPKPDIRAIFDRAQELADLSARNEYLDRACGDDRAVRTEVEELLKAADCAGSFMHGLATAPHAGSDGPTAAMGDVAERAGTTIGPYKLLQKIGEGGMGVVFMAEQTRPVSRIVALKIIKPGMDSRQVIARFEAERQALALMDHPNIARVLDAGTTSGEPEGISPGRPFFVMELVRGAPITEYCDQHRLTPRERLELFVPVCQAVQHAHQKGIIHRDLKPSNVLIARYDGRPVAKVIDFGVAKAMGQRLTERTMFTEFGALVGTVEYMSPEQAELNQLDIDTRTDVYTLGVLLYELLTGSTPFDKRRLKSAAFDEMLRIIREEEPPKPSTRVTGAETLPSIAARRGVDPKRLSGQFRGELDWIVMKCLEKDRNRRYEAANGLAHDIQRFLADEAVSACPPSAGYRLRKFVRRNKRAAATAAIVASALVAGATASTWQAVRATRAESAALQSANKATSALESQRRAKDAEAAQRRQAEAVVTFLVDTLRSPDPALDGREIRMADVLDRAVKQLPEKFGDDPSTEAMLLDAVATSYHGLGLYREATPLRERVHELCAAHFGAEHRRTQSAKIMLAQAYQDVGRLADAIPVSEEALRVARATNGDGDPLTISAMGTVAALYRQDRQLDRSIALHEEVFKLQREQLGPDHPHTLRAMQNLATAYGSVGRAREAAEIYEDAMRRTTAVLGPTHPETLIITCNLASMYYNLGRHDLAMEMMEQTMERQTARLGADHPRTLLTVANLAKAYGENGRNDEAIVLLEKTIGLMQTKLGEGHPRTLSTMEHLSDTYRRAGRGADAVSMLERAVGLAKATQRDHPYALNLERSLANAYRAVGRAEDAVPMYRRLIEVQTQRLGPSHPNTLLSMQCLADAYRVAGKLDDAIPLFQETRKRQRATQDPDAPATLLTMYQLGLALEDAGRFSEAEAIYQDAVKLRPKLAWPNAGLARSQFHGAVDRRLWNEAVAIGERLLAEQSHDRAWASPRNAICRAAAAHDEVFNRLVAKRPDDAGLWLGRAWHWAGRRDWPRAAAAYQRVPADQLVGDARFEYACLQVLASNMAGYQQLLREGEQLDDNASLIQKFVQARMAGLAPQSIIPAERAIGWAAEATTTDRYSWFLHALALSHYRAGHFDEATRLAAESNTKEWSDPAKSQNWFLMALSAHRAGRTAEAADNLAHAQQLLAQAPLPDQYDYLKLPVPDLLGAEVLRREAELAIGGADAAGAKNVKP